MTCEEARDLASDYLDRRLTPFQNVLFREHLDACADCRRELADLDRTIAMVGSLGEVETAPDFLARVNEKIDRGRPLSRLRARLFEPMRVKLPLEAAALLLVSSLAFYFYHREPDLPLTKLLDYQGKEQLAQKQERRVEPPPSVPPAERKPPAELDAPALKEDQADVPARPETRPEAQATPAAEPPERPAPAIAAGRAAPAPAPPEAAAAPDKKLSLPAPPIAADLARRRTEAKMVPFEIVEVAPEDVGRIEKRIHALVPELGGRIITKQSTEGGLTLAIELPQSRAAELKSVLSREAAGEDVSRNAGGIRQGADPSQPQAGLSASREMSLHRGSPSDLDTNEPNINIELRIRPRK